MSIKALFSSAVVVLAIAGNVQATIFGDATFYFPGTQPGACGEFKGPHGTADLIVALDPTQYAGGSNCFRNIGIHHNNKYVKATVVDLCPSCSPGSIDLSPQTFSRLESLDVGMMKVKWSFV
ncbi:RlpA-like double-psi beta-barrel-protein domain-containing protein-containing protein [Trametes maxima]|nr:RlpA-like double-psi beta-barrel-protein domain-containing protein-containing protein [Trametes maxima]